MGTKALYALIAITMITGSAFATESEVEVSGTSYTVAAMNRQPAQIDFNSMIDSNLRQQERIAGQLDRIQGDSSAKEVNSTDKPLVVELGEEQ